MTYTGWEVPDHERARLLMRFPPEFADVVAHHVTLAFPAPDDAPLPPPVQAAVVGIASDHRVQALVIAIDGTTRRPDGGTFHCTWSLDRAAGAKPVMSNALLARGFTPVPAVPLRLVPQVFVDQLPESRPR